MVGGRKHVIEYLAKKGFEGKTTSLQIMRNYANAARQIGGIVYRTNEQLHGLYKNFKGWEGDFG